jgi:hypothetical protein
LAAGSLYLAAQGVKIVAGFFGRRARGTGV